MTCNHKHTKINPTGDLWKCPKCGDAEKFIIESSLSDDCTKLHCDDELRCSACGYGCSGAAFVAGLVKTKLRLTVVVDYPFVESHYGKLTIEKAAKLDAKAFNANPASLVDLLSSAEYKLTVEAVP